MFERICPKCNVPMVGDRCVKETWQTFIKKES